ncbi:hypothetical protein IRB79_26705 (plasmid) [Cytobacillus oceanisediminis]|nr:hypothetical protein IRB79_26705 [Cytobacillus oceanisediminis]
MNKKSVVFSAANVTLIQSASLQIAKAAMQDMGVSTPPLSQFIGEGVKELIVDVKRNKFVAVKEEGEDFIPFHTAKGKQMIDFLMVVLPARFPKFMESAEFQALDKLNLKGRLTAKAKVKGKKTRETILMAALNLDDIIAVASDVVLGKLRDFSAEELMEKVMEEIEEDNNKTITLRKNVRFYIAKDTEVKNLNNLHSLYQKMSGSLAAYRFATALKKRATVVNVVKEYKKDGMVMSIEEPQLAVVLDEMCVFDGSGSLPFGEANEAVLKAIFSGVTVLHSEEGTLEMGANISGLEEYKTYKTYAKSMSQARSGGAVGFDSIESIVTFFLGTGQDERAYGKTHYLHDENGKKYATGYKVMDVAKAYKRFMLAASNGQKADKGLLSRFSKNIKVEEFKKDVNGLEVKYVVITNSKDEKITMAFTKDFTARIPEGQDFLLNVLDENNALVNIETFKHWDNPAAVEALLTRNLTDGGGWASLRIVNELREAGILNSFDAFQTRISHTIKGAVIAYEELCGLFGADLVITEGMVKAEDIVTDIRENGFQLFVVGQRKDGNDGLWLASQATQQMGLDLEELKRSVDESVAFAEKAMDEQLSSDLLTMMNAADEEAENEFAAFDYLRLAEEFGDVLDEQYIKDEIVSLTIKKLNKLLDGKMFIQNGRVRYMFSDPVAIYNAAKAGRYEVLAEDAVLNPYEAVLPSKKDGEAFMETGDFLSNRYPITVTHEIPVVTAVDAPEYAQHVEAGLWQGCIFFDVFSWVVAQQAGADHDGDSASVVKEEMLVNARLGFELGFFGNNEVLPFIDAYVKYEDGEAVEFGTGCPTYVTEVAKKNQKVNEAMEKNGFAIEGNSIIFDPAEFEGENGDVRRREFLEIVAEMSQEITVNTIETSLIGVIANRAMILTDLLTRSVLTGEERVIVELDLLFLTTAGRWEIDRPKHGGAYLEMPRIKELFANFKSRFFDDSEMELTDAAKYELLAEEKGVYRHIFGPVKREGKLVGFEVKKPQWLASQKEEYGARNMDSTFQQVFGTMERQGDKPSYAEEVIEALCAKFAVGHSNNAKNNIRGRVNAHMEVAPEVMDHLLQNVNAIYAQYSQKERIRSASEKQFREYAEQELRKAGVWRKKNLKSLTKAKRTAKLKAHYEKELSQFSMGRDLYKAEFRKEMYAAAKAMGYDVRALVGALYLIVSGTKINGKASFRKDGREYRFSASNGFIALPFEVFAEEMSSLISGKISETYFVPQDVTFTLLQTTLFEGVTAPETAVKVRVLNPVAKVANKTVAVNRTVRVAVKPEEQKDSVRLVMYFLNKDAQVMDAMSVTREDTAYIGFAPTNFMTGIYEIPVTEIAFGEEGTVATVRFQ